ncbi:36957_t:CDS:2, partial [Racocetra persica]
HKLADISYNAADLAGIVFLEMVFGNYTVASSVINVEMHRA